MDDRSAFSSVARAPARPTSGDQRIVALDQELLHLLEPLRSKLTDDLVVARMEPLRADVYVTAERDVARIRALRRQHRELVIVVVHCSAGFPRALHHRTLVDAVNAGASAYLVDAPAALVITHVAHVGRIRPRRAAHPRHWVARR
jgi:hypothetical protein